MKMQRCKLTLTILIAVIFLKMSLILFAEDLKGQIDPRIVLKDRHVLTTSYLGSKSAASDLELNRARGLSLASGDFDEDGVQDLVAGYDTSTGGLLTLYRGNIDAIHPNSFSARERRNAGTFTDAPFLSPAKVFELPVAAEFLAAGDFDLDKHFDVVTGSSSDDALYLMRGNGKLGFSAPKRIPISGKPTAFLVGEINRLDTVMDLIVAVDSVDGSKVLVFDAASGSLKSAVPEVFSLPAKSTGLALGRLDQDHYYDLAVATGNKVTIIHGRNEKNYSAKISSIPLSFESAGLTIGNFSSDKDRRKELAVSSVDGRNQILSRTKSNDSWETVNEIQTSQVRSTMMKVKVSTSPTDDLAFFGLDGPIQLLNQELKSVSSLNLAGQTKAILPMRLTPHALNSLVILESSQSAPSIMQATPSSIFIVTNTLDKGPGSLRDAIKLANKNPGLDEIQFQIGTGPQTIVLNKGLPAIKDAVTIDGTTQPSLSLVQNISLDGSSLTKGSGLKLLGGLSTVKGLAFTGFPTAALLIKSNNNFIEGNVLGISLEGANAGNWWGIKLRNGDQNTIGGSVPEAQNMIANNEKAIDFKNADFINIQGNTIGKDASDSPMPNVITINAKNFSDFNFISNDVLTAGPAAVVEQGSNVVVQDNSFTDNGSPDDVDYAFWGSKGISNEFHTTGDYNGDARINSDDYTVFRKTLGSQSEFSRNSLRNYTTGVFGDLNGDLKISQNDFTNFKHAIVTGISNPATLSNVTPTSAQWSIAGYEPSTTVNIELYWSPTAALDQELRPIAQTTGTTDAGGNLTVSIPYLNEPTGFVTSLVTPDCFSGISTNLAADLLCTTSEFSLAFQITDTGNLPPVIEDPGDQNAVVGVPYTLILIASDPNGDPLGDFFVDFSPAIPPGISVSSPEPPTVIISGTPLPGSEGNYTVEARISDGTIFTTISFNFTVTAPGSNFTVVNTNDSGPGSLRQAILDAIASGQLTTVLFNIPGAIPHTISLTSPLPSITTALNILGSSQPGYTGVTPVVGINGSSAGPGVSGLVFSGGDFTVDAIFVNGFAGNGIQVQSLSGTTTIMNSFIGTNVAGNAAVPNGQVGIGISLNGGAGPVIVNNLVSANATGGIVIQGGPSQDTTEVRDNIIGLNFAQTAKIGNGFQGLLFQDAFSGTVLNNVISGNFGSGALIVNSTDLIFQDNIFGTNLNGDNLGNTGPAVFSLNVGSIQLTDNVYANNFKGVVTVGSTFDGGVQISGGEFLNQTNLDVDNGDDGPDTNDPGDPDGGPNGRQNFALVVNATTTFAAVTLNSKPNTTYVVQLYKTILGTSTLLDSRTVITNASGNVAYTVSFGSPQAPGTQLSTTVIGPEGNSEFGPRFTIP